MAHAHPNDNNAWTAQVEFRDRTIEVRVDRIHKKSEADRIARESVAKLDLAWPMIQANLAESLHHAYNHTQVNSAADIPLLDREEFLAKISIQSIEIMDKPNTITIYFHDEGLFGGRTIAIIWPPDQNMNPAQLID